MSTQPHDSSSSRGQIAWQYAYSILPWLSLALLFWLPGVYLEFPADPWAHFARMTEWSSLEIVMQHSAWSKSSYFLAYSLVGRIAPPLVQLEWLNLYYTGCCLLLCWQYYLLGQAIGLGKKSAFIFVLLQAILLGNNIFGFYRYYGISSSLFAQVGAVGLIRFAIEAAKKGTAKGYKGNGIKKGGAPFHSARSLLFQGANAAALLALTAFNHVQGLGIAGIGISAAVVWRLIEWRRSMIVWLALFAVALSGVTILLITRNSALDEVYRPHGWLTAWYGFNLFSSTSPAFDRTAAIIGLLGSINIAAGLLLLRRNHLVAWLTLMPLVMLCLPLSAIPFTNLLASRSVAEIITFHRMFFAIPAGLALLTLLQGVRPPSSRIEMPVNCTTKSRVAAALANPASHLFPILLLTLFALVVIPANGPIFNRLYQVLMRPPADLTMQHWMAKVNPLAFVENQPGVGPQLISVAGAVYTLGPRLSRKGPFSPRLTSYSLASGPVLTDILAFVRNWPPDIFLPQTGREVYSPYSFTGHISGHWPAQKAAWAHMGGFEFEQMATALGYRKIVTGQNVSYLFMKRDPVAP